jgi:hypothetical protein
MEMPRDDDIQRQQAWGVRPFPQRSLLCGLVNGYERAFSYDDFWGYELMIGGDELRIYFATGTVFVRGRRLRELSPRLGQERVAFLQEKHVGEFEAAAEDPYIERIEFGPADPKALGQERSFATLVKRAVG